MRCEFLLWLTLEPLALLNFTCVEQTYKCMKGDVVQLAIQFLSYILITQSYFFYILIAQALHMFVKWVAGNV